MLNMVIPFKLSKYIFFYSSDNDVEQISGLELVAYHCFVTAHLNGEL